MGKKKNRIELGSLCDEMSAGEITTFELMYRGKRLKRVSFFFGEQGQSRIGVPNIMIIQNDVALKSNTLPVYELSGTCTSPNGSECFSFHPRTTRFPHAKQISHIQIYYYNNQPETPTNQFSHD